MLRDRGDRRRNGALGIDQRIEHRRRHAVAHAHDGDLGDTIAAVRARAGRFHVDDDERLVVELAHRRGQRGRGRRRRFAQAPPAVAVAREPVMTGEQRRRHVLGDAERRARQLADVRDERLRIGRARGEKIRRAVGEQRIGAARA